jgi:phosphohistidine phosphatase
MGRWLRAAGYIPDRVVCSTACRAAQTWQLAQPALGSAPSAVFDDHVYDADAAQLLHVIRRTPGPVRTLLVVGHDPALPGLARMLAEAPAAGGGTGEQAVLAADRMRAKFPTAAVAAFVFRSGWDQLAPGAALLSGFNRLASGEGMPEREKIRAGSPQARLRLRRTRSFLRFQWAVLLLSLTTG